MRRSDNRLSDRWTKDKYEASMSSKAWYGTPYGGGWTELAVREGLPEDRELGEIFLEEMKLGEVPDWARRFAEVYLNEPWLPYCGHYTFPNMLLQTVTCIGKEQVSTEEMTARCYRVDPERRELLARYLFCIDAWLKGAGKEHLVEKLKGLGWSERNWEMIAGNIYDALGERDEDKALLLRRIMHRQRWWLRALFWTDDKPLNEGLGYYYGKTYLDKEKQMRVDEYMAEFEDPEVVQLEAEIRRRFGDADKWLSMIQSTWLCGPKAFRYLERQLLHVGNKSLSLSPGVLNRSVLMCEDTCPQKEHRARWYGAFRWALDSWLEGKGIVESDEFDPDVVRKVAELLGSTTPTKHWLARLLRHKLDLYEEHSGFDKVVSVRS